MAHFPLIGKREHFSSIIKPWNLRVGRDPFGPELCVLSRVTVIYVGYIVRLF